MGGDSGVYDKIQDEAFADLHRWPRQGATCISTRRGARDGIGGTELGEGNRRIRTSMTGSSPYSGWARSCIWVFWLHNYEEYDWEDDEDKTVEIMTDDFIIQNVERPDINGL